MLIVELIISAIVFLHNLYSPDEGNQLSDRQMSTDDKRYFQHTLDYFPSVENDASRVTWAHAVNSREKLQEALQSLLLTRLDF